MGLQSGKVGAPRQDFSGFSLQLLVRGALEARESQTTAKATLTDYRDDRLRQMRAGECRERVAPVTVEDEEEVAGRRVGVRTREVETFDRDHRRCVRRLVPVRRDLGVLEQATAPAHD